MNEGNPKVVSAANFAERERQKTNESARKELGITPDGYVLYPGESLDITVVQALELAASIVRDNDLETEGERLKTGKINFGLNRESLAMQRGYAKLIKTEGLLRILSLHKRSPHHYVRELLLAVAEELLERLPLSKGQE